MSGDALAEPERGEDPEPARQPFLAVAAFLHDAGEFRRRKAPEGFLIGGLLEPG